MTSKNRTLADEAHQPPVACRFVRKMKGRSQAHLIEGDDGRLYVVKFQNNLQGPRTLINELIAVAILRQLKITSPETRTIAVSREFLRASPDVYIATHTGRVAVKPGLHFGSCYLGTSDSSGLFDCLPDALFTTVTNLEQFRAILVFDRWVGNMDQRQCVFVGMPSASESTLSDLRSLSIALKTTERTLSNAFTRFIVSMIDHGQAFNGDRWEIPDSGVIGLYPRGLVYRSVRSIADFNPWLGEIESFPAHILECAVRQVPPDWIGKDDSGPLERLLETLTRRQKRIAEIVNACLESWTQTFQSLKT